MTLAMFFLATFLAGAILSLLSFASGHLHVAHFHFHVSHGAAGAPHVAGVSHAGAGRGTDMPFLNFATLTAFLTWFGGSGYLLTRYSTLVMAAIVLVATLAGLSASAVIFWFVVKLMEHDRELDPADYERVGVLGRALVRSAKGAPAK